jgi:5-methyltetrahydrofolate corrinoid/iron sulfur protein methyltransferase
MILIGDSLRLSSRQLAAAFENNDGDRIQRIACIQESAGMDYISLDLGMVGRSSRRALTWAVKAVQLATSLPLLLSSSCVSALGSSIGFPPGRLLIHAPFLDLQSWLKALSLANRHKADLIGCLSTASRSPRDAYESCGSSIELVESARNAGVPFDRIWIDPGRGIMADPFNHPRDVRSFIRMLSGILPGCKIMVSLSDISVAVPLNLKSYLNQTALMMLTGLGLHAFGIDAFDQELVDIARGRKPRLVKMVQRFVAGEIPQRSALSARERLYLKMISVLNGDPVGDYPGAKLRNASIDLRLLHV